jgi:hypothetical protein
MLKSILSPILKNTLRSTLGIDQNTGLLFDTFTNTNGTLITNHVGESTYNWVAQSGITITNHAQIFNNRVYPLASNNLYRLNYTMPVADYEVEGIFQVLTNTGNAGVSARCSSTANTFYLWRYNGGTAWQLFKFVNGTATALGSPFTISHTAGEEITAKIVCNGTTIEGWINGVQQATAVDSSIVNAGSAGFRYGFSETTMTGLHLNKLTVRNL